MITEAAGQGPSPQAKSRPRKSAYARSQERLGWLLMLPAVTVVSVVALYPLGRTFWNSLTNIRLGSLREPRFVGLDNYRKLLDDETFINSIRHTLTFAGVSVFLEAVLGLVIALTINSKFPGRGLVRTAILVPWAIPVVVSARMWAWMYNDIFGVLNDLLYTHTGILPNKIAWISDTRTSLPSIIAVDVWKTTPFMALLLLAGLQIIPSDLYEAAMIDGASKWRQFWGITLPLLKPALLVALVFRTLDALRVFDVIFVMNAYATDTMSMAVFARQKMIDLQRLGEGSAASVVIFGIIACFVLVYTRLIKTEDA
jgi:trehalose/maltose transport system permease protein